MHSYSIRIRINCVCYRHRCIIEVQFVFRNEESGTVPLEAILNKHSCRGSKEGETPHGDVTRVKIDRCEEAEQFVRFAFESVKIVV